ncbi:MAG TPA: DUF1499 domain-containing protein [Nitrospirales bacterium]|jgi:uncharacterized protein (DUF1499 family)
MRLLQKLYLAAFGLAILSGSAGLAAGLGTRWGLWHFKTGFLLLTWAAYGALFAAFLGLIALLVNRSSGKAVFFAVSSIVLAILVAGIPWQMKQRAQRVPRIHDITTDTENPPSFVAILPLRQDASNPPEYAGEAIAAQQLKAYPDIRPLTLTDPPDIAFEKALRTAHEMGWDIVETRADRGRIEATDTTLWFGFKDDIVVRVTASDIGSRIDVRSVSRVGKSDVGTNAARIRTYLTKIQGRPPSAGH